jgi:hypothetical protein
MNETNHFFNLGYGWLCKHCSAEDAEHHEHKSGGFWNFFHKSDPQPEPKKPQLPSLVLARWTDASRRTLTCPRCSIEELVSKA